jgi:hypothetical protein
MNNEKRDVIAYWIVWTMTMAFAIVFYSTILR